MEITIKLFNNMREKLIQSTTREVIDPETGEITTLESSKVIRKRVKEDSFYMTFIDFISPFIDNLRTCDNARRILTWLCMNAEFNTGKVFLTTGNRAILCKDLNISSNTLTNNLRKLKDANLISGDKGDFVINPQIFWKGDLSVRKKLLEDSEIQIKFEITPKSEN
jgi:hypothetical protein